MIIWKTGDVKKRPGAVLVGPKQALQIHRRHRVRRKIQALPRRPPPGERALRPLRQIQKPQSSPRLQKVHNPQIPTPQSQLPQGMAPHPEKLLRLRFQNHPDIHRRHYRLHSLPEDPYAHPERARRRALHRRAFIQRDLQHFQRICRAFSHYTEIAGFL